MDILVGINAALLICVVFAEGLRRMLLHKARRELRLLTNKLVQISSEQVSAQADLDRRKEVIDDGQMRLLDIASKIRGVQLGIEGMKSSKYVVVHQFGEPASDKAEFRGELAETGSMSAEFKMCESLRGVSHEAVVFAESEAQARRVLAYNFPERHPLKAVSVVRRGKSVRKPTENAA